MGNIVLYSKYTKDYDMIRSSMNTFTMLTTVGQIMPRVRSSLGAMVAAIRRPRNGWGRQGLPGPKAGERRSKRAAGGAGECPVGDGEEAPTVQRRWVLVWRAPPSLQSLMNGVSFGGVVMRLLRRDHGQEQVAFDCCSCNFRAE